MITACRVSTIRTLALVPALLLASCAPLLAETATFTIDASRNVKPISRYIYGVNQALSGGLTNLTLRRMGGNRWSAYNWVNNASNAGSDWFFHNDDYLGGGNTPGGAVAPAIRNASQNNAAILLTIPMAGYVAADKLGTDVRDTPDYLNTRFRQGKPAKGSAFTLTPNPNAKFVYQDEFVNWVKVKYPYTQTDPQRPVWFSLDNEPDLWRSTHEVIHPDPVTYAEMVEKTTAYAKAIKAVMPKALVLGPVNYGFTGYVNLQYAPDANNRDFQTFYLQQMKLAHQANGKRLLDVLDVHWYPEAQGGGIRITLPDTTPAVIAARIQAPRSLWDPNYKEDSWIANDYFNGPVKLLPYLYSKIADAYPGTKLAFTEYNYGGGGHISGGIAQADVLGIFGREGVFAATQWPLNQDERFNMGALKMYRNFDGENGSFGDKSVFAKTSKVANTSVYASLDSTTPKRMVVVAINKTDAAVDTTIKISNAAFVKRARVYQLTGATPQPKKKAGFTISNPARFTYRMPAMSVTTLVLTAN